MSTDQPAMRTVRIGTLRIRVWGSGASPALVCFPPAGGSALAFRPLAAELAPTRTVVAVDLPGHGASAGPALRQLPEAARLARAVLAPWLSGPAVLLGHSFGGYVAYETARQLVTDRASSSTTSPLVSTTVARPALRLALVVCATAAPTTPVHLPDPESNDGVLTRAIERSGGLPASVQAEPELLRHYLPALRADLAACAHYWQTWANRPPLPVPTLVVGGRDDAVVPPPRLSDWRELCVPSWFRLLPGGHHFPQQAPAQLAVELDRWMDVDLGWSSTPPRRDLALTATP